ncbi:hypothetical protein BaRGS_00004433 [Batillaria attramentaria]|uniref:Uncharacterized protein n=1 Tax=Batillaria attramentaria TaxID=370345 RepID=A0ABD0LYN0_9CAEN
MAQGQIGLTFKSVVSQRFDSHLPKSDPPLPWAVGRILTPTSALQESMNLQKHLTLKHSPRKQGWPAFTVGAGERRLPLLLSVRMRFITGVLENVKVALLCSASASVAYGGGNVTGDGVGQGDQGSWRTGRAWMIDQR